MADTRKIIGRILKVNHAGEYGAIRIYMAQLLISRILFKDLVPFLEKTLKDEIAHCEMFYAAMAIRNVRPCYTMWLWSWGGFLLGSVTALMGRNTIMVCTEAVEDAVHHHMNDQIVYLSGRDEELKRLIENIKVEELEHLHFAHGLVRHNGFTRILFKGIFAVTEILIWLSTQGNLTRMKQDLGRGG
jgi:ubiquinone biosynthesis monooxygenase Coq7